MEIVTLLYNQIHSEFQVGYTKDERCKLLIPSPSALGRLQKTEGKGVILLDLLFMSDNYNISAL